MQTGLGEQLRLRGDCGKAGYNGNATVKAISADLYSLISHAQ
jgi:hypothetical protein